MGLHDPSGAESRAAALARLRLLSRQFPNLDSTVAEIARLSADLTLPKGAIHVLSDVHGEDVKLRHVVNNASGTLRPLVERHFAGRLSPAQVQELLSLLFYPAETLERLAPRLSNAQAVSAFARRVLRVLCELVRVLARRCGVQQVLETFPLEYRTVLRDLGFEPTAERGDAYIDAIVDSLVQHERALHVIRLAVRVVRDLTIEELIVAGDCFDRGPRGDRIVEFLQHLPNVSFTWGNHDMEWLGACLGQEALIAHVLRVSLRYRRLSQLEEGYGITMQPLEHLVRTVYADDPAECFKPRGSGLREPLTMARMQKAAAVMQFKLEGQTIARNPQWNLENRRLLHRIDYSAGTIELDGVAYPLRDKYFPTIDPANPYELSPEERACMDRLRRSFLSSQPLWKHMRFLVGRGAVHLVRDRHLIFHGCIPVDEQGGFLPFVLEGVPYRGRALFEALTRVIGRTLDAPTDPERDLLWYLWSGPLSPMFGKDRITTLERDLVEDPHTHVETKNPYFRLIHEAEFCERVLTEFDVDPQDGLIINGHVPVKLEQGESPVKRSGKAITIDGAFSEAYGDHGFTLVMESERTFLAKHHHFDSVEAAVRDGVDIIPEISIVREWDAPRRVADTERGADIRAQITLLESLADAYRTGMLRQGR
jgi:fructose-1,6-bisphosphatase-3